MSYFVGVCEWCGKIVETDKDPVDRDDDQMSSNIMYHIPHYICADCLYKALDKKEED